MNTDIYNPTEYWTPENLPDGVFVWNGEQQVDANYVWNRLRRLDWHNLVENFHAVIHFGITQNCDYSCLGETFQFFLDQ